MGGNPNVRSNVVVVRDRGVPRSIEGGDAPGCPVTLELNNSQGPAEPQSPRARKGADPGVSATAVETAPWLARHLRALYDRVALEPLPPSLSALMALLSSE